MMADIMNFLLYPLFIIWVLLAFWLFVHIVAAAVTSKIVRTAILYFVVTILLLILLMIFGGGISDRGYHIDQNGQVIFDSVEDQIRSERSIFP